VWTLRRHLPRWFPPITTADETARLAELAQERAGNKIYSRLVAAIEFGERPNIPGDMDLKNQVIREARSDCADPYTVRLHDPRHTWLAWRLGSAALVLLIVVVLTVPETALICLQRMGGALVSYPTLTHLVNVEWQQVSPARQNYPIRVTVSGRIPPPGVLHIHMSGRRNYDLPLAATDTPGVFSAVVPTPDKSFAFFFQLGDFESESYSVSLLEPMYVKKGTIFIQPPAYTQQPASSQMLGNLSVPDGSTVRFEIVPDRSAESVLWTVDGHATAMQRQSGGVWTLALSVTNSLCFEIDMQDSYGMGNSDRLKHNLLMLPDLAPVVEVRQPKSDGFISVASLLPFDLLARDDYGLIKLEINYDVVVRDNDVDTVIRQGSVSLDHGGVLTGRVVTVQQVVRVADLNLNAGQHVVFHVLAADNKPDHPNVGQASDVRLQVVTPDELKRVIEGEMTQTAALTRKLRDSETQQAETIAKRLAGKE